MNPDEHKDAEGDEPEVPLRADAPEPVTPSPDEELPAPFASVEGSPVADVPAPVHSPDEAAAHAEADRGDEPTQHDWLAPTVPSDDAATVEVPASDPQPEPEPEEPEPEPEPVVPEPTPTVPLAAATPSRPAGTADLPPVSTFPTDAGGAAALPSDRPEVAVGLAFAGGALAALILKRLAR